MTGLPEICTAERTTNGIVLVLMVRPTLKCFDGHFEGCPLLPGVVQINWAIEFSRTQLDCHGAFRALHAVKFMRVIQPDTVVTLKLELDRERHALTYEYQIDGQTCSVGTALFDPPP